MNIAVLFTGEIRITHDVVQNIKYLFSDLTDVNIDFFCTTWYKKDIDIRTIQELFEFKIFDVETYNKYTTQFVKNYKDFEKFVDSYKNEDYEYNLRSDHDRLSGVWKNVPVIFYKLNRGINLINEYQRVNNINYDLILRLRWDAKFTSKLSRNHLEEVITDNKLGVYIHSFEQYESVKDRLPNYSIDNLHYHKYVDGWVDETIYYGNPAVMNIFGDVYNTYYDICVSKNCWIIHVILKEYINQLKIHTIIPNVGIELKNMLIYHYYLV
jgi:hypothetical protein